MSWDRDKATTSLLRNKPVKCENIELFFPSLGEVLDLSDRYFEYVQVICFDPKVFLNEHAEVFKDYTDFEVFYNYVMTPGDFQDTFFEAIKFFTKETFLIYQNMIGSFYKNEEGEWSLKQAITEEFWEEIRQIMFLAHQLEFEPRRPALSEKAKEIERKLKANKEKIQKIKDKESKKEKTSLAELVSAVAAFSNSYNLFNIWDLNYFQFFDQYQRMTLIDNYHFTLDQILAGVDPKKLEIRHWASSTQKD